MRETKQTIQNRKDTRFFLKQGLTEKNYNKEKKVLIFSFAILFLIVGIFWINKINQYKAEYKQICSLESVICEGEEQPAIIEATPEPKPTEIFSAWITGYNTLEEQTDNNPCISASGMNICGRDDIVACPRKYPFGTKVEIDGKIYECQDRTASHHDGTFDISCDKDLDCPYQITGTKEVKIYE